MPIHFWHLFWRSLVDFPGLLSGNWLSTIILPLALYALFEVKSLRRGWSVMTLEAKREFWRNSGILVVVYLLLFAWVVVKDIYQDHEYLKTVAAKYKQANTSLTSNATPHLIGSLENGCLTAPWQGGTVLTIQPIISNDGAPSIVKNFSVIAHFPDGTAETGRYYPPPPEGSFHTLGTDGKEPPRRAYEDDFIEKKALNSPITQGAVAFGLLMRTFHTKRERFVPGTIIELTFQDVKGHQYSTTMKFEKVFKTWQ